MRKNQNYVLTVTTVVERNANEATVGSGGVYAWRESGVRRSALCWYVLAGIWLPSPFFGFVSTTKSGARATEAEQASAKIILQQTVLLFNTSKFHSRHLWRVMRSAVTPIIPFFLAWSTFQIILFSPHIGLSSLHATYFEPSFLIALCAAHTASLNYQISISIS
jgi:hypothetical protein